MKRSLAFLALSVAFLCPSRGEEIFEGKTPVTAGAISLTTDRLLVYDASTGLLVNVTPAVLLTDAAGSYFNSYDADLTSWAAITPGTGVGTFLATPSSANLRGALTDESGTGVFLTENGVGAALTVTASGFNGNLTTTDDTVQEIAQKLDDLVSSSGSVATDTIWDAAGDLVYGTGANTAARLAPGTAGQILTMNGGATAPAWSSSISASTIAASGAVTAGSLEFEGATADAFETALAVVDPTADRTITFPNATGTVILSSDLGAGVQTALATPSSANLGSALTDETGIGVAVFGTGPTLTTPTLNTPTITSPIYTEAAIAASAIDWAAATTFTKTLAANTTFTFSNLVTGKAINVALTNTASNYTVTWPTVSWSGGAAPAQTVGVKTDIYTFIRINGTVYGSVVQNF